ncbi:TIGR03564 family F420-dependent LLM class oxidoreductase [Litorivivens sp.]|uniref:TIGR03564 family F420-dependent LLM class oxidoreductase n=1 Tax=Litorivivens sp. TaxID=2020868 RepID=UPI00356545D8
MNIGFMCGMKNNGRYTIDDYLEEIRFAQSIGLDQAWMGQVFSADAISVLTLAARETTSIRLGTAVTPIQPRHPTSLALQALTANAASAGRFDLGIGLSHKLVIEDMYGLSYKKPAQQMREYLQVLAPLCRRERCDYDGDLYRVHAKLPVADAGEVPIIVAALGPAMLKLAGQLAAGTTTWMTGPKTLAQHTIPLIRHAAAAADKPQPRVVASFPIVLTDKPEDAKTQVADKTAIYGHIPSYKAMLDQEGAEHPVDLALIGDKATLRSQLQALKDLGVDDFNAFCMDTDPEAVQRTLTFLAEEKTNLR